MGWPDKYIYINARLKERHNRLAEHGLQSDWYTIAELAKLLGWTEPQTRYWCERMVSDRWMIWRYHPERHGWYTTKQYACPWFIHAGVKPL